MSDSVPASTLLRRSPIDPVSRRGGRDLDRRRALVLFGSTVAATTLLAGCAEEKTDLKSGAPLASGEGIAYGRIKVEWKGKEQNSLTTLFGEKPWSITLLPDESSTARDILLGDAGAFAWHLPAGGYTIVSFHGTPPNSGSYRISGRISAHFTVAAGSATDIGMLKLDFIGPRYRMSVAGDTARGAYAPPELPAGMPRRTQLMQLERRR